MTTYNLGGNASVARFEIGTSQLKFSAVVPNRKYQQGAIQDATGLRILTFFFANQAALAERFKANGLVVPEFRPLPGSGRSSAFVQDPSGQWVELVIAPNEPSTLYARFEIGLVVSDIEVSRKFYREFIGLEELPVVKDTVLNTIKYPYRHGSVTVSLRCFGTPVPADTGSRGIQYVASDVKAVQDLAEARHVKIDQRVKYTQRLWASICLARRSGWNHQLLCGNSRDSPEKAVEKPDKMWSKIAGIVGIRRSFAQAAANSVNSLRCIRGICGRVLLLRKVPGCCHKTG